MKVFTSIVTVLASIIFHFSSQAQYKITENIYVDAPVKYTAPVWKNVATVKTALTKPILTFFESFIPGHEMSWKDDTQTKISIGSLEDKPVLFFGGYMNQLFFAELNGPGSKIVISSKPQTFVLKNFLTPNGAYSAPNEKLEGSVTLSCNGQADLIFTYDINVIKTPSNTVKQRWTGKDVISKVEAAIIKPVVAEEFKKYIPVFENFITYHYNGWQREKYYYPNSIWQIKVLEKNAAQQPIRMKANFKFSQLKGGDSAWVELFLHEGKVFGVKFYDEPDLLFTPGVDENNNQLAQAEIARFRELQHQYLSEKIIAGISKGSNLQYGCLSKDTKITVSYLDKYENTPIFITGGDGRPEFDRYERKYVGRERVETEKHFLINKCIKPLTIVGIQCGTSDVTLSYKFSTYTLKPGESIPYIKVEKQFNNAYLNDGLMYYYIK